MMGKEIGHMVSRGAKIFKMASEEGNLTDEMSIELFSRWKVDQLKTFLKKRGVVLSGRKYELAEKAYFAWKLNLEVAKTTREEEDDVSTRRREKLTMECGITLPFPGSLHEGWEESSLNFPDVMEDEVETYIYMQPSTKAMKRGKSLLNSGHVHNVKFHHISTDLKYCFIHCRCVPQEKISSDPYALAPSFEMVRANLSILCDFKVLPVDHLLYKLGRGHR